MTELEQLQEESERLRTEVTYTHLKPKLANCFQHQELFRTELNPFSNIFLSNFLGPI